MEFYPLLGLMSLFSFRDIAEFVLIVAALMVVSTVGGLYVIVRLNSRSRLRLEAASLPQDEDAIAHSQIEGSWIQGLGYEPVGVYSMNSQPIRGFVAGWRRCGTGSFVCLYRISGRYYYDFITLLDQDSSLTTAEASGAHLFPRRPREYCQSFPGMGREALRARHNAAVDYLAAAGSLKPVTALPAFQPWFLDAVCKQYEFVQSVPLWQFRGLYWFFVRRFRWHNKTIEEQHKRGWIDIPQSP